MLGIDCFLMLNVFNSRRSTSTFVELLCSLDDFLHIFDLPYGNSLVDFLNDIQQHVFSSFFCRFPFFSDLSCKNHFVIENLDSFFLYQMLFLDFFLIICFHQSIVFLGKKVIFLLISEDLMMYFLEIEAFLIKQFIGFMGKHDLTSNF